MDSAKGAKAALEKLKKEQAVSEFKTQQEIWKWLVEGGKVQNKELGEEVLHFKDGHLVQLKTGIGVSCSLLHHSHWRKYTEPFKSSTEIYARKGRHIQDNPAFLMDRLNLSDWSRSKKGDDYIKVRITVEQIEE